jgi:hypothetical protein
MNKITWASYSEGGNKMHTQNTLKKCPSGRLKRLKDNKMDKKFVLTVLVGSKWHTKSSDFCSRNVEPMDSNSEDFNYTKHGPYFLRSRFKDIYQRTSSSNV